MKTIFLLVAVIIIAAACKKESTVPVTDERLTSVLITDSNDPGIYASMGYKRMIT